MWKWGKKMQSKLKPLGKGSKPSTGKISDAALSRVTGIPKSTLITWSKTDKTDWRHSHYSFLKSHTKEELLQKSDSKMTSAEVIQAVYIELLKTPEQLVDIAKKVLNIEIEYSGDDTFIID